MGAYGAANVTAKDDLMAIQTVGVIGAGQMGNGIAHVLSQSGYSVLLNDVNQDALERAIERVRKNMDRQLRGGKISAGEIDAAMGRIKTTLDLAELGTSDLIIEAATEDESVKQKIFDNVLPHLKPNTILTVK